MKYPQSGFTTMELLATVVLAGVLLALAAPSFSRMMAASRLVDQTNELVGALTFGRSEAIRRNTVVTLCRTDTVTSTECASGNQVWQNWVLLGGPPGSSNVLRRGTFRDFGNSMRVRSTLTDDRILFSPDGLARTGGSLVGGTVDASGNDTASHSFTVCTTRLSHENVRKLALGAGSRIRTSRDTESCN
jgi:type IV fimbrial biogenesis protein FimT